VREGDPGGGGGENFLADMDTFADPVSMDSY
jgi:hypothetical protein